MTVVFIIDASVDLRNFIKRVFFYRYAVRISRRYLMAFVASSVVKYMDAFTSSPNLIG